MGIPILSIVTFLPLLGAVILLFIKNNSAARWIALFFTVVDFLVAIQIVLSFDRTTHNMQFVEHYSWIPSWNITYFMGIDGISVLFIFLSALLGWICVLASWRSIEHKVKEFMMALLVMQTAMIGVFCALDFFLFYLFWEAMLIPMYLIIGVWGGKNRIYAAIKFFLCLLAIGSGHLQSIVTKLLGHLGSLGDRPLAAKQLVQTIILLFWHSSLPTFNLVANRRDAGA